MSWKFHEISLKLPDLCAALIEFIPKYGLPSNREQLDFFAGNLITFARPEQINSFCGSLHKEITKTDKSKGQIDLDKRDDNYVAYLNKMLGIIQTFSQIIGQTSEIDRNNAQNNEKLTQNLEKIFPNTEKNPEKSEKIPEKIGEKSEKNPEKNEKMIDINNVLRGLDTSLDNLVGHLLAVTSTNKLNPDINRPNIEWTIERGILSHMGEFSANFLRNFCVFSENFSKRKIIWKILVK